MKTTTTNLGNNEQLSTGVFPQADGTFLAMTFTRSKTFKTLAGASRWFRAARGVVSPMERGLAADDRTLANYRNDLSVLESGGTVENLTIDGAKQTIESHERCIANKKALIAAGRGAS